MLSATEALEKVRAAAESIKNDETATIGTASPGDVVRQGDLYLICLTGHQPPKGDLAPVRERQLAPGTSQGSRHVLKGRCRIFAARDKADLIRRICAACPPAAKMLAPDRDEPLVGPIFRTDAAVTVTHPEHGDRVLPKGEWFAVVYQRAFADEVRRQQD